MKQKKKIKIKRFGLILNSKYNLITKRNFLNKVIE